MTTPNSHKVFRAFHVTERLKLSSIPGLFSEKPLRLSNTELVYSFAPLSYIIIYNFGSIVFFNVALNSEKEVLATIQQFTPPKDVLFTREEFALEIGDPPKVEFGRVVRNEITFEEVQMISLVLARSTALEHFETIVDDLLEKSEKISRALEKHGRTQRRPKDVIRFIGFCLNTKQKIVASTYILDSPDPAWDSQNLESLYRDMVDMFEVRERYWTLEYKLKIVQETMNILTDISRARSTLNLEVAIVVLIAIEVLLFLYELFGSKYFFL